MAFSVLPFVQGVLGQGGDRIRRAECSRLLPERGQSLCLGFWNCKDRWVLGCCPGCRAASCRSAQVWPRVQRLATSDRPRETSSAFWTREYWRDTYNDINEWAQLTHQSNIKNKNSVWLSNFVDSFENDLKCNFIIFVSVFYLINWKELF